MGPTRDIKAINPFPGLRPFAPQDSDLFFGREVETGEVISKLLRNHYITIIGPSGNGKSSLIFSGVLPKILNLKIMDSSEWKTISFRPGNDPFGNLATALTKGINDRGQAGVTKELILSELLGNTLNLSDVVRKFAAKPKDNVLLVLDQFEELFRYNSSGKSENPREITGKFVDLMVNSVAKPDENIFVILGLRSEYLGECSHYKGLTTFVNNSNYLVPEMTTDNFIEVIEGPINIAGAKIDTDLVGILLNDIGNHTFKLPLLQHAMMRTWAHWQELDQPERPINVSDYEMTGTMYNAISIHADEVYEELNQRGKEICASLFKIITRKDPDNRIMRHPADIETIKSIAGCSNDELFSVIDKFRSPSCSFILPPAEITLSQTVIIDLQNEYLIGSWNRLKVWVDEEAVSREIYLRLSEASALYQQGKAGLLRSPDLEPVIAWRNNQKPTLSWAVQYNPAFERAIVYLRTSEKSYLIEEQNKKILESKKIRRNRFITRLLEITILIASGFLLFAYIQKLTADKHSAFAEKEKKEAEKGKALADSFAIIVLKQKIVSDSTAAASVLEAEMARQQKVVADIEKNYAEKSTIAALRQKNLALKQSDSIREVSQRADQNTKIAIEQKNEAQRLRMLSVGKSLSLKSLQVTDQKDLEILLAYQAWLFNKRNKGLSNDADIYAGLYNAGLQYNNSNYSFNANNGGIKSIAFLPGKNEFFTSGNDGKVLKWSLDKKDQSLQVLYSGNDIIEVLAVSPDASWLACGSSNSSIKMIPLKSSTNSFEMNGHTGGIKSLVFSCNGKYLYSAALDGKVLKWDIAAKTSINVSSGEMEISSIDISSRGNYLAGISNDGKVIVWNPEQKSDNFRIETSGRKIRVVRFNPDNNLLALGDADGTVELWDINLRKKLSEVQAHIGQINDIQFNTVLKQMATSGEDKKLKIYNIEEPGDLTEPPVTFADNVGIVLVMQFSPDGQMIVSGESGAGNKVLSRPTHVDYLARNMSNLISRNMTQKEWNTYVARDIPFEKTSQGYNFNIIVEPIKPPVK